MISAAAETTFAPEFGGFAPEQEGTVGTRTAQPLTELLAQRWSPRSFDPEHVVEENQLVSLIEAARWAPSSRNGQARRFVVGRRDGELFKRISATLYGNNAQWAPQAALLVVGVLLRSDEQGREEPFAEYDLGQAVAHLGFQAESIGLRMRQVGGFDRVALTEALGLTDPYEPFIVAAVGRQSHAGRLPGELAARELAPRTRVSLTDLVLASD